MQSYEHKRIDARALKWLDGELDHPDRFKIEYWDGRRWVQAQE